MTTSSQSYHKTTVANKKRGEPYDVYIGRGSPFGNPYTIGIDGDRDEVIDKYRYYFQREIRANPAFVVKVDALAGKRLGCFCRPAACHGDVISEYLNAKFNPEAEPVNTSPTP